MTFANPAFLWALPALGIPIALHMMQWQVPRPITFPTIRFIRKASEADRGKRGLRDLLTLLTRLALMALAILLLAGPRTADAPITPTAATKRRTLLFVDLSASMNGTNVTKGVNQALTAIETMADGGEYMAIASADGIVHRSKTVKDPKRLRDMVSAWSPTLFEGQHSAAVADAILFLSAHPQSTCYVVSDFQSTDWSRALLKQLTTHSQVKPILAPSKLNNNVAVIRAESTVLTRNGKKNALISATLRNFSVKSKRITLRCSQGDRHTEKAVSLSGGETLRVDLNLAEPSGYETIVSIDGDDGYEPDDQLWMWTGPRSPLPLALLTGKRTGNNLERYFLSHALAVRQPGHVPIRLTPDAGELLMSGELTSVRALAVLDGFRDSGSFELQQIMEWVKTGGTLICFAGDGFINGLANLNSAKISTTRPGIIRGDRAGLETFFLGKYDKTSKILTPFANAGLTFDSFPIFRYVGLAPSNQTKTLIQFDNGDPFLVREPLGNGQVFLFATGLLPQWSEFATSRQFLPLVRRIVESSGGTDDGVDHTRCKPTVTDGEQPVKDVSKPGIVRNDERPTVVNVSRVESNPDMLDPTAIGYGADNGSSAAGISRSVLKGRDLTTPFAIAVIAFLLLELIIANAKWKRRANTQPTETT